MPRVITLGTLAVVVLALGSWAMPADGQGGDRGIAGGMPGGRFQLYRATYEVVDLQHRAQGQEPGLFKIDTATGRVWKYRQQLRGERVAPQMEWVEVQGR